MHRLAIITDGMILFVYECLEIEKTFTILT